MKTIEIDSLLKFIEQLDKLTDSLKTYIFRGQSSADWKIESGAYRRISYAKRENDIYVETKATCDEIKEYLKVRIAEIKKRLPNSEKSSLILNNDFNLLIEMQHYGGATNLIDFTFNALVALYFACFENQDKDGVIYCIDYSDTQKILSKQPDKQSFDEFFNTPQHKLYAFVPAINNLRIVKQDSIFLYNDIGYIDEGLINIKLVIKKEAKKKVIKNMKDFLGIYEEMIYPDFQGYLNANNSTKVYQVKSYEDYYNQANEYYKDRQYNLAIDYYNKSLEKTPRQINATLSIARSYRRLKNYQLAKDFSTNAITLLTEKIGNRKISTLSNEEMVDAFYVYVENGIILTYLTEYNRAKASLKKAESYQTSDTSKWILNNNWGWLYLCWSNIDKAREYLEPLTNAENSLHPTLNLAHCYIIDYIAEINTTASPTINKTDAGYMKAMELYKKCAQMMNNNDEFERELMADYSFLENETPQLQEFVELIKSDCKILV